MNEEWTPSLGAVVTLKSGGPKMTVREYENFSDGVYVVWVDRDLHIQEVKLPRHMFSVEKKSAKRGEAESE